jgi:hypothetical protein
MSEARACPIPLGDGLPWRREANVDSRFLKAPLGQHTAITVNGCGAIGIDDVLLRSNADDYGAAR